MEESCRSTLLVQELASMGRSDDVPRQYVLQEHRRPSATATAPIPLVDIGRLSQPDGGAGDGELEKLRLALESWGLFMGTNHGIDASLMDGMMNVTREFFHLPLEERQKYSNLIDGNNVLLEGYGNDKVISKEQILDWSDRLVLNIEPQDERNLPLWPQNPKPFIDVLNEFTIQCNRVKNSLMPALAKLLNLNEDFFIGRSGKRPSTVARFNYYPPCPRPDHVFGIKPHSDASILTIVLVDNDVPGLQVLRDGVWYDVPASPHTLLINMGDETEIMTNGIFKSPMHRALTNAMKERISVAMFFSMDLEEEIEPASELIDEKRPAMYKKVKAKDYFAELFEHFSKGTRVIDRVKI